MLHADLGGVLDLLGGAAQDLGEGARGHGAGGADLPLAADLGAGDRGVLLEQHADGAGRQQEADDAVVLLRLGGAAGREVHVVVQHCRDDAGGAVRRGGDDAAARGVLLVDRHRVEGDPLHRVGLRVALGAQLAGGVRGTAADLEAAGQDALARHAAGDARLHGAPDAEQAGADLLLRAPGAFVLQHQRGDRQAGVAGEAQQFVAGTEGVLEDGVVEDDPVLADGVLVDDEAAADRVVRLLQEQGALVVVREDRHAVGVVRQRFAAVEDQLLVGVEGDLVHAEEVEPAGGADRLDPVVRRLDVDGTGGLALQAEQDGLGGAVAVAGGTEGAEELGAYRDGVGQQALVLQPAREHTGRAHGADRMGAGRADADREQVEDRDGHG